jgi:hypothetical protein
MRALATTAECAWLVVDGNRDECIHAPRIVSIEAEAGDGAREAELLASTLTSDLFVRESATASHVLVVAGDALSRHLAVFVSGTLSASHIPSSMVLVGADLELEIIGADDINTRTWHVPPSPPHR